MDNFHNTIFSDLHIFFREYTVIHFIAYRGVMNITIDWGTVWSSHCYPLNISVGEQIGYLMMNMGDRSEIF